MKATVASDGCSGDKVIFPSRARTAKMFAPSSSSRPRSSAAAPSATGSSTVAAAAATVVTSSSTAAAAAVAAAASSSAVAPATRSRVIDREFGMLLLARRSRKAVMVKAQASLLQKRGGATAELAIPAHFRCPISLDLMRDLVMATMGITYDREGIEAWLDTGRAVCPVTHAPLWLEDLVPNHTIRHVIQDWCVANRSHGVERIPTPKIPATPIQASEMLFNVAESARCGAAEHATERSSISHVYIDVNSI